MWTPTDADDLHAFLRTRRSIRRFKPDPVPAAVIERILTSATYAPSAHNLQPWRFALVQNASARARLAQALSGRLRLDMTAEGALEAEIEARMARSLRRIVEAPLLLLLCRDIMAMRKAGREEEIMAIQSVANAATYLLLAAHAEGLGGNWICWPLYAQEPTRAALNLPTTWQPQAMFFIGYANETPREKTLKPLEEVTQFR